MSLTLLTGPMGAGKTTLSNRLAAQYDAVHHSDVGKVDKNTGKYVIPTGPEKARAVEERLQQVLRDHQAGKRVLLDGYPASMVKEYRRLLPHVSEVLHLDPGALRAHYSVVKRSFQRGSSPVADLKYALQDRKNTAQAIRQIREAVGKDRVRRIGREYGDRAPGQLEKKAAETVRIALLRTGEQNKSGNELLRATFGGVPDRGRPRVQYGAYIGRDLVGVTNVVVVDPTKGFTKAPGDVRNYFAALAPEAAISATAVAKKHRGKGIARKLRSHLQQRYASLITGTGSRSGAAMQFLNREQGFVPVYQHKKNTQWVWRRDGAVPDPPWATKHAYVLAHLEGAPGSGKSTIMQDLQRAHPQLVTKDLDSLVHEAQTRVHDRAHRGLTPEEKARVRQVVPGVLAEFLAQHADRPVLLAGTNVHAKPKDRLTPLVGEIPAEAERLLLDVGAARATWRAYWRTRKPPADGGPQRTWDWRKAKKYYDGAKLNVQVAKERGYRSASAQDVRSRVGELLQRGQEKSAGLTAVVIHGNPEYVEGVDKVQVDLEGYAPRETQEGVSSAQGVVAMQQEMTKEALDKEALFETLRVGLKAAKQVLLGGKKLLAPAGVLHAERQEAVVAGEALMKKLHGAGSPVHRARVKSPGSITANNAPGIPNDLLGLQMYANSPAEMHGHLENLRTAGMDVHKTSILMRPGYHGVNAKGMFGKTPVEVQISPGRLANMGQIMEHSLVYKPQTEAPLSNAVDRWVGKNVAPRMVQRGSWLPRLQAHVDRVAAAPPAHALAQA